MNTFGKIIAVATVFLILSLNGTAQKVMPLYKGEIPNSKNVPDSEYNKEDGAAVYKVSKPTLTAYFPDQKIANGTAIVVCPGGGYSMLVMEREGYEVARRLNKKGIAAFVLKYRLPGDVIMENKSIGPLQDAQQAIKLVRENAKDWGLDPQKVGIMGFSAGGHLASTAGTHFNQSYIENKNNVNLRPDFMILIYPVISMQEQVTHQGSRNNLLGEHPSEALIHTFSNELQVTAQTPPAFITQAEDDKVVPVENSLLFYHALHQNHLPVSLHIYEAGGHGFIKDPPRDLWMEDLYQWMKINGWLE